MMPLVHSWGRKRPSRSYVVTLADPAQLPRELQRSRPGIARGFGSSYGDACLNEGGVLWHTTRLDHFIDFDPDSGRLRAEAGVSLRDIQALVLPRGWTLPVTPGTLNVTLGGAIANDVHGKNQHVRGSFGNHVSWLRLVRVDGEVIECTPTSRSEWLHSTIGGVGLTGLIVAAELTLAPSPGPFLQAEHRPFDSLAEYFALAGNDEAAWEHVVAWLDVTGARAGRGILSRARPVKSSRRPPKPKQPSAIPATPPMSLVNSFTTRAFNAIYFAAGARTRRGLEHHERFLYPLDGLSSWNRLYGPAGFFQYHCLIPHPVDGDCVAAMVREVARAGAGSPLAVLKRFGADIPRGMLSFCGPGTSLALDLPNRGEPTQVLLVRLDALLLEAGGRLYLAKDARMPRRVFEAGYPRHAAFEAFRDPGMSSSMSRRLMGH